MGDSSYTFLRRPAFDKPHIWFRFGAWHWCARASILPGEQHALTLFCERVGRKPG